MKTVDKLISEAAAYLEFNNENVRDCYSASDIFNLIAEQKKAGVEHSSVFIVFSDYQFGRALLNPFFHAIQLSTNARELMDGAMGRLGQHAIFRKPAYNTGKHSFISFYDGKEIVKSPADFDQCGKH
jgi:hypothetical protein